MWQVFYLIDLLCLSPLSAILWFSWWKKLEYSERTTDHGQATGKLYHLRLRVECTLFCNLKSRARRQVFEVRPSKKICVFTVTCQKNLGSVGRHSFFSSFFLLSAKPKLVVPGSGIRFRYFIFEISGKPSFVEAVIWQVTQFFYLLCSQFWQKASGWINKTLLLNKQQKWLSEFCVKIYRVTSKN